MTKEHPFRLTGSPPPRPEKTHFFIVVCWTEEKNTEQNAPSQAVLCLSCRPIMGMTIYRHAGQEVVFGTSAGIDTAVVFGSFAREEHKPKPTFHILVTFCVLSLIFESESIQEYTS